MKHSDPPSGSQPRVLTIREVAGYLRVHTSTIYRLLRQHEIPAFKIGSDWRFNRESIDEWLLGLSRQVESPVKRPSKDQPR